MFNWKLKQNHSISDIPFALKYKETTAVADEGAVVVVVDIF